MNIAFRVKLRGTDEYVTDYDKVMSDSGLEPRMGYEDIGIQSDGTPVIFDKCGGFGYLSGKYDMEVLKDE